MSAQTYWLTTEGDDGEHVRPWFAKDGEDACEAQMEKFPNERVIGVFSTDPRRAS